ncbi:hydrolase [Microlunatus endophyticus]|uniref:Hydrolase n=1 Tax=Microlunatus endophyticus TaxID=1716077 RepID=A0A917SC26_9ACTN|nr:HAD family phosphatase [Microlunatus endophyticus]GGL66288.1 hydrolase [Microlunatus endophyticus]
MTARTLIVFDCDGVLVDSERLMQDIDLRMIADLGWPITREEIFEQHLGRSEPFVDANIARHIGHPVPESFVLERRQAHAEAFRQSLAAVPGVETVIARLQAAGFGTCVASSGTHERIRLVLGLTGLRHYFADRIFSADDVEHSKPAPDLFLHAAASLGYEPSACIVVEDSPSGVTGAKAAGMRAVAFCALTPVTAMRSADVVITGMAQLGATIENLVGQRQAPSSSATRTDGTLP